MGSRLVLEWDFQDFPYPPLLTVLGSQDGRMEVAIRVALHEPISTRGMAAIAKTVTRMWVEPELAADSEQSLLSYVEALGVPSA